MGTGNHGGFGATIGALRSGLLPLDLQFFASKAFENDNLTEEEIQRLKEEQNE